MDLKKTEEGFFEIGADFAGPFAFTERLDSALFVSGGPCSKGCCHFVSVVMQSVGIMGGVKLNDEQVSALIEALRQAQKNAAYSRAASEEE